MQTNPYEKEHTFSILLKRMLILEIKIVNVLTLKCDMNVMFLDSYSCKLFTII